MKFNRIFFVLATLAVLTLLIKPAQSNSTDTDEQSYGFQKNQEKLEKHYLVENNDKQNTQNESSPSSSSAEINNIWLIVGIPFGIFWSFAIIILWKFCPKKKSSKKRKTQQQQQPAILMKDQREYLLPPIMQNQPILIPVWQMQMAQQMQMNQQMQMGIQQQQLLNNYQYNNNSQRNIENMRFDYPKQPTPANIQQIEPGNQFFQNQSIPMNYQQPYYSYPNQQNQ